MNIYFATFNATIFVYDAIYKSSNEIWIYDTPNSRFSIPTDSLDPDEQQDYTNVIASGILIKPIQPSIYHIWDGVNDEWVLDTVQLFEQIDLHLQELLASRHLYVVDSVDAYFKNDLDTRQAISDYLKDKDAVNNPSYLVKFKARDVNDNILWVDLNGSDIQGLHHSLTTRMKNAFTALKAIQDEHGTNPYTDVQSALDDFDTQLGGL